MFKFWTKSFLTYCIQEIRRHLRQKRPQDTTSYDASLEDEDEETDEEEGILEKEEDEGDEEVDEERGTENSEVTDAIKLHHRQEIGVETLTETKNVEEEGRHVENQTKHTHDRQHHRLHHKEDKHRGKKKTKVHAITVGSTVVTEESVRHNKPGEKFDETLFEGYDTEVPQNSTLVTTEHSRFHHRHHQVSTTSRPNTYHSTNLTTDHSYLVNPRVEVTLDYLDFNGTEEPSTERSAVLNLTLSKPISEQRVKLSKPTDSNENKVSCLIYLLHEICNVHLLFVCLIFDTSWYMSVKLGISSTYTWNCEVNFILLLTGQYTN